jgi:RNA polymerase sigma factor (sigma-70 family)
MSSGAASSRAPEADTEPIRDGRGSRVVEDRPPAPEAELVARARRGDRAAFDGLVAAHQQVAFRTAYLVLGDAGEAEDAAQEAFVKAYGALGRFREGSPFRPWLLKIVGNAARNRRRSGGRRRNLELRISAMVSSADTAPSAEAEALVAERRAALVAAIDRLPPDDRLVIGARYFLELSEAEIAELAGVPRGTVKSRLSRARGRLAAALRGTAQEWTDG